MCFLKSHLRMEPRPSGMHLIVNNSPKGDPVVGGFLRFEASFLSRQTHEAPGTSSVTRGKDGVSQPAFWLPRFLVVEKGAPDVFEGNSAKGATRLSPLTGATPGPTPRWRFQIAY